MMHGHGKSDTAIVAEKPWRQGKAKGDMIFPVLGKWLGYVVKGYFTYHAVPTNIHAPRTFRDEIIRRWWRTLCRRSDKADIRRDRMKQLAAAWLPQPCILHPWPNVRFAVRHPR